MKNIVGQIPRKENFYRRDKLINKIYRRLEAGNNLFLSAPRRVGKTSVMRFLQDFPQDGFQFIYVITESVYSEERFYQLILEELLRSEAISQISRTSEKAKNLINQILDRIQSVTVLGSGFEIREQDRATFIEEFERLLAKLDTEDDRIILMIDEFPQTVENIKEKHGAQAARLFLQRNRSQRQQADAKIQMIYTGSIGLRAIVKQVGSLELINDLNEVEIPPLSQKEATDMTQQILDYYGIPVHKEAIPYLLERIDWLIPFHIQMAIQEIIDIHENTGETITPGHINNAFDRLANIRNDIYFESYVTRLRRAFEEPVYSFASELLNTMAEAGSLNQKEIDALAASHQVSADDCTRALESLSYDGYINNHSHPRLFRFNSPILQLWWKKYKRR